MATSQEQVNLALNELKLVKRNKSGTINQSSLWAVAKRHKAYPNFSDYEDTEFSELILAAVKAAK